MDEAKREGRNTPSLLPFCSSSVQDIALPSAWPRPFHPLKFRPSVCGRDPEAASKGSIIGAECNRPWKPIPPSCTSNPRFEESLKKKEKISKSDEIQWNGQSSRGKRGKKKSPLVAISCAKQSSSVKSGWSIPRRGRKTIVGTRRGINDLGTCHCPHLGAEGIPINNWATIATTEGGCSPGVSIFSRPDRPPLCLSFP